MSHPLHRSSPFLNGSIDQIHQDTPPSTRIDHRQHATWWEYIGWTSTSKATDVAADAQHPQVEDVKVKKDNTSTAETEASVDEGKIERVEPTHAEMAPPTTVPAEVTSPASMSQRTRDDTGPSAWYVPWSWYGSGGQVVGAQTGGGGQDNTVQADPSSDLAMMFTQSVTQDVAVDFPPDNGINAGQHEPEPLGTDSNEVSAQGSKADVERDQNGMEVMNIDEDEGVTPERSSDVEVIPPITPPPPLPVDVKKETPRFLSLTPRKGNSGTTTRTPPSSASSVSMPYLRPSKPWRLQAKASLLPQLQPPSSALHHQRHRRGQLYLLHRTSSCPHGRIPFLHLQEISCPQSHNCTWVVIRVGVCWGKL